MIIVLPLMSCCFLGSNLVGHSGDWHFSAQALPIGFEGFVSHTAQGLVTRRFHLNNQTHPASFHFLKICLPMEKQVEFVHRRKGSLSIPEIAYPKLACPARGIQKSDREQMRSIQRSAANGTRGDCAEQGFGSIPQAVQPLRPICVFF
jgi:hypothetical protein